MTIDIVKVAEALLLEPEELEDIFEAFFEEADETLADCKRAMPSMDYEELKKLFHDLKGSAANLHLKDVTALAKVLEAAAREKNELSVQTGFPQVVQLIEDYKEEIRCYYGK
ncbi:Hpt domain-containing protein [Heliophilum fasciatum]|uniref:Hpt domain-containing protein n=1 Tax=Heliophilum fasciatum TaxID=35700 RepID=A0A4R2RIS2_9FIRM|nr:Hpt domain-containing protein [Heliophilum fasciatum]MCW2278401.1 HPt (histidine-containing phosphotransfer) domain-containing protein [Heliophilum fasciatum]TCP63700.1 Hpt domain-containing protein [Heliophilum fasciatum]